MRLSRARTSVVIRLSRPPVLPLVGCVLLRHALRTWSPLHTFAGIWLPGCFTSQRVQVSNNVTDLLVGDRLSWRDVFPIWMTEVGPPSDHDGSETLITHQCEVAAIRDLLLAPLVARCACRVEKNITAAYISLTAFQICRHTYRGCLLRCPARAHS